MRRRRKKRMRGISFIYITSIIVLSLMGIGYGMWNDKIQLNFNITTGNFNQIVSVDSFNNSNLNFSFSDADRTLYISGEIYHDSSEDICIKILDTGSVPSILESIDEVSTNEITDLSRQSSTEYGLSSFIRDDLVEELKLSITPCAEDNENNEDSEVVVDNIDNESDENLIMEVSISGIEENSQEDNDIQNKINEIQEEINAIQAEIDKLSKAQKHSFRYNLRFIQGI